MRLVILLLFFAGTCYAQNHTNTTEAPPSTTDPPDDSNSNYMRSLYILVGVSGTLLFALTIACLCARRRERRRRCVPDVIPLAHQFANPIFCDPTLSTYESPYPASVYPYVSPGIPYPYVGEGGLYPRYE